MFFQDCTTVRQIADVAELDWDSLTPTQASRFQVLAESMINDRQDRDAIINGAYDENDSDAEYLAGRIDSSTDALRLMAQMILGS